MRMKVMAEEFCKALIGKGNSRRMTFIAWLDMFFVTFAVYGAYQLILKVIQW